MQYVSLALELELLHLGYFGEEKGVDTLHFRLLVDVEPDGQEQRVVLGYRDRLAPRSVLHLSFTARVLTVDVGRWMVMLEPTLIAPTHFRQSVHPLALFHAVRRLNVQGAFRLDDLDEKSREVGLGKRDSRVF